MFKDQGIKTLVSILDRYKDVGLFTINERAAAWLVSNESTLGPGTKLMLNKKETIEKVLSKKQQADAARKAGLSILNTYYLTHDKKTLDAIVPEDYPLCIRPSGPGSVRPPFKVEVVHDREALEKFMVSRILSSPGIIAQPFLNLPNLLVHGSRKFDGQPIGLQGFLVESKFEGLALSIRPIILSKNFLDRCARFTAIMGIYGAFHFDFLYDQENTVNWFLEINARLGGTTAKAYSLGYDEPGYLLQSYGYDINITDRVKKRTSSGKLALLKYLIHTLEKKITLLDYPADETRLKRILKTIQGLAFYRDDIFSLRDIRGTIWFYRAMVREKLTALKSQLSRRH